MVNHVHSLIPLTSEVHQYGTLLDRRIRRYFLDRVSMVIVGRVPLSQLRIGNPDKPIRLRPITQLLSHLSYRISFDSRQNLYPQDIRDSADEEPTEKQNAINDEKENKGGGAKKRTIQGPRCNRSHRRSSRLLHICRLGEGPKVERECRC